MWEYNGGWENENESFDTWVKSGLVSLRAETEWWTDGGDLSLRDAKNRVIVS